MKTLYMSIFQLFLSFVALALGQTMPQLTTPAERFAAPGEFVTLVFRLEHNQALSLEATVSSASNWRILRQPGEIELSPRQSTPIAVTIEVPADAAAFSSDVIRLELHFEGEIISAEVRINVTELFDLTLEVPRDVVLSPEGFSVIATNNGNTTETAMLSLLRGGQGLEQRDLELAPQTSSEQNFLVTEDGLYSILLTSLRGTEIRKTVNVIRFGTPPPQAFALSGKLLGDVDSNGSWQSALLLAGPLSDFAQLEACLEANNWRRSFSEVMTANFMLRLGEASRNPYRLNLSADFGLSSRYEVDSWSLSGALGWLEADKFSGYLAGAYDDEQFTVAAGAGLRAAEIFAAARSELSLPQIDLSADFSYRDAAADAAIGVEASDLPGTLNFRLEADQLLSEQAALRASGSYDLDDLRVYASGMLPLAGKAASDWGLGVISRIPSELPGELSFGLQAAYLDYFAKLGYQTDLGEGWRSNNLFSLVVDETGLGLSLDSRWTQSGSAYLSLDGRFTYYPGINLLDGQVGASFQTTLDAFTIFSSGGWDIGDKNINLSAGGIWRQEPWNLSATATAGYDYAVDSTISNPWSVGLSLSSSYAFGVAVPESLTTLAGGRRLGHLSGVVRAGDLPLAGVEISIGRFRVISDELGRYHADLAPGSYRVSIDIATLPITYRLVTANALELTIEAKEEMQLDFIAIETAALEGRVLTDSNADGAADEPPRGAAARLVLVDAEGLQRSINTDADGNFRVRGLLPGPVRLRLTETPVGSTIVGEESQSLSLTAGEISNVTFLLEPAIARAQTFTPARLRIRRIEPEVDRVPPGTAPLIRVEVQGEPERVILMSVTQTTELRFDGQAWLGRVNISTDTPSGVFNFNVSASQGNSETERRGQIIVDSDTPALIVETSGPVRAGEILKITVRSYFAAESAIVQSPFADELSLSEDSANPGLWSGELTIPANIADAVYTITVKVGSNGKEYQEEARFRVLAP